MHFLQLAIFLFLVNGFYLKLGKSAHVCGNFIPQYLITCIARFGGLSVYQSNVESIIKKNAKADSVDAFVGFMMKQKRVFVSFPLICSSSNLLKNEVR
jgi:hypothetical protein